MNKRTLILYFISFFVSSTLFSQHECGSTSDEHFLKFPRSIYENYEPKKMNTTLNLRLIAVQDENGENGVSPTEITELRSAIEAAFFDHQIDFDFCVIKPKDPGLLNSPWLEHIYTLDNAINLLVVPSTTGSIAGTGRGNKAWASIADGFSTSIHELGHCFGLLHTFHQDFEDVDIIDENGNIVTVTYIYEENAERDASSTSTYDDPNPANSIPLPCYNCEILGDRLCDTPADRELLHFCTGNNFAIDLCGERVEDDAESTLKFNFMDYFNNDCRSKFSDDQVAHMHATINAVHGNRISGNEPVIDYTVIDQGGYYDGIGGEKFVILDNIDFDTPLTIINCRYEYGNALRVSPEVKLTFNGSGLTIIDSDVTVLNGPYPECNSGPTFGTKWKGIEHNGGVINIMNSTFSDAKLPLNVGGVKMSCNATSFFNYEEGAIKCFSSSEINCNELSLAGADPLTIGDFKHIEIVDNHMYTLFNNCHIEGNESIDDTGISIFNSGVRIIGADSQISNCTQGALVVNGSLSTSQGASFNNCSKTAIETMNGSSVHCVNTYFTNCATFANSFKAIDLNETPFMKYEIVNLMIVFMVH